MDAWKKTYSNASSYDEAMNEFWNGENHFDRYGASTTIDHTHAHAPVSMA